MASPSLSSIPLLLLLLIPTITADPDALQDFCVADTKSSTTFFNGLPCLNPNEVTGKHFTTSVLSTPTNTSNIFGVGTTFASTDSLPGINTLGISISRADVGVGGIVPPHSHARANEIAFVLQGKLLGGFVDSSNRFFNQTVNTGDVIVFPKGTIHFFQNLGESPASLIAAFNSQNPGVAVTPFVSFRSNPAIPPAILAKAFQISEEDVGKIRKGLGGS
ncbi:germin-like protein 5-1 [Cryptomeria japonica]|uniref:germin-like protein 5-1 n=1 Tax=Cryptomeria japonica TaxID=3369 RepID=UPI0025ABF04B|nr:germin-like protein 5-1 [Cryptomeria japonica]